MNKHWQDGRYQQVRLENEIIRLGGKLPEPWPWAVIRIERGRKIVDSALYNLQLIEAIEDMEKQI